MWETRRSIADWVYSKTQILLVILKNQSRNHVVSCVFLEVELLFHSVGCVGKQISVSHGSTESEVISLDAGLRKDGLLALDLWDLVISVSAEFVFLHCTMRVKSPHLLSTTTDSAQCTYIHSCYQSLSPHQV